MVLNASAPGNVAAPIHLPAWQKAFFSVFSGNGARSGKAHFQAAFIFPRDKNSTEQPWGSLLPSTVSI